MVPDDLQMVSVFILVAQKIIDLFSFTRFAWVFCIEKQLGYSILWLMAGFKGKTRMACIIRTSFIPRDVHAIYNECFL